MPRIAAPSQSDVIRPQPGPQEQFLRSSADIVVYGGAAGGGKTYAGLLEHLYHVSNPLFRGVMFRRIDWQLFMPGGLWQRSFEIYPNCGATPLKDERKWVFPSGAEVNLMSMHREADIINFKGAEFTLIEIDELTDFTEFMFWYLFSRMRSMSGVKPYMRCFTNPDPDSWVKTLVAPWVDNTFPDKARSGEVRWFIRENDVMTWVKPGTPKAKSITFIFANVHDNKKLLEKDPDYLNNLEALPDQQKRQLLFGDWNVRPSGKKFKREWFVPVLDEIPNDLERIARFWDLAATEDIPKNSEKSGPDFTASVKAGRTKRSTYCVLDATWDRKSPGDVEELIRTTAESDGKECLIYMEQEPGSGGVNTIDNYRRRILPGYAFYPVRSTGSKEVRANPVSSMSQGKVISMVRAWWNDPWLNFLCAFPNNRIHDDPVDAFVGVMTQLFSKSPSHHLSAMRERLRQQQEAQSGLPEKDA